MRRLPCRPQQGDPRSVAATIYNVWRGEARCARVDRRAARRARRAGVGLGRRAEGAAPPARRRRPYTGVGRVGRRLLPGARGARGRGSGATWRCSRRCATRSTRSRRTRSRRPSRARRTRTTIAGASCTASRSTTRSAAPSRIPPPAGFADLAPELRGLSRDGGYEVVNASGFSARADRRERLHASAAVRCVATSACRPADLSARRRRERGARRSVGRSRAIPATRRSSATWLTADYHPVTMLQTGPLLGVATREVFVPGP